MSKIAAIQMCSSYILDENLETAKKMITEAASEGAALIVLPENFAMMGRDTNDKNMIKESFGHGKIQSFLSDEAKTHGIWLVGGTIPITSDNEQKTRAACLVYDDKGKFAARYDKIHLFDATLSGNEKYNESDTIQPGDKIVSLNTSSGKLGLAVCYDVRFPELFRCLFDEGVEIIALPSAFTVPTGKAHWEVLLRSRAIENFSYVIAAAQAGTHASGRTTWGHSMIVEPWGNIAAEITNDHPGIVYAEFDVNKIHEARKSIPIKNHRRIFFNKKINQEQE